MRCSGCDSKIPPGEQREHSGKILCEDCYMDNLATMRPCDPWATHSAKSLEKYSDSAQVFTPIQRQIIELLSLSNGLEPQVLLTKLAGKLSLPDLQRELTTLRHMEKIGGERIGDKVVWKLWEQRKAREKT